MRVAMARRAQAREAEPNDEARAVIARIGDLLSGRADHTRRQFMTVLSLLGAALAALGVMFTAAPLALLPTCA